VLSLRDWILVPLLTLLLPAVFPPPARAPARAARPARAEIGLLDGVTFAADRRNVYVPVPDLRRIGIRAAGAGGRITVAGRPLPPGHSRRLLDGTHLASVRGLRAVGVPVLWDRRTESRLIAHAGRRYRVRVGTKRIVISKAAQRLRSWQGARLVAEVNVSTGKPGHGTPSGAFSAGPFKARMHTSRRYNNAPMPWCTQVLGDICMHGSASVPRYPASHGCIRVPLTGANPARWLWEWVDAGAAVAIRPDWPQWAGAG